MGDGYRDQLRVRWGKETFLSGRFHNVTVVLVVSCFWCQKLFATKYQRIWVIWCGMVCLFPKQLSSSFPGHVFSLNHYCCYFFVTVELVEWVNLKAWKQSTPCKINMFSKKGPFCSQEIHLPVPSFSGSVLNSGERNFNSELKFEMHESLLALTMLFWNGDRWLVTVEVSFWERLECNNSTRYWCNVFVCFHIECFFFYSPFLLTHILQKYLVEYILSCCFILIDSSPFFCAFVFLLQASFKQWKKLAVPPQATKAQKLKTRKCRFCSHMFIYLLYFLVFVFLCFCLFFLLVFFFLFLYLFLGRSCCFISSSFPVCFLLPIIY